MLSRQWISRLSAVLASAAMVTASIDPAPAFTLAAPSLKQSITAAQIDKVWWRRWGCGWGCGWGPFAIVGAAGALATGIVAAPFVGVGRAVGGPYYYGPGYYGYAPAYYAGPGGYAPGGYGPCWRRVWGAAGWQWARAC
jgi:hypothetical protein